MFPHRASNLELGPHAIDPCDEEWVVVSGSLQVKNTPEPTNLSIRTWSSCGSNRIFDSLHKLVSSIHRDTSIRVSEGHHLLAFLFESPDQK
jgi:hypothetical protein